ncbi:ferric uptake regulator, Fur family [Oscillochloris trichoides DG-6]|uniref:Ferric uptake regulator, Fur family n=1 Tax=Oscillochloris trichoides DG-6 TaxID=765420 RepID=E1ICY9_9CHLR|nr:Fur family transcriptional regulator [Oscillochloris trichoides]EFO80959.1 ferric uptake regulator, Fur family [Oscillochloris trichoides DG-6]
MSDYDDLIQHLRANGHRLTPQRRMVLEALQAGDHHMSADEIAQQITARYPTISIDLATIYRTLRWLRDVELVSETSLGQNAMIYALRGRHDHHHLVCTQCHTVIEIDPEVLEPVRTEIMARYAFAARLDHIAIFGLCAACRQGDAP